MERLAHAGKSSAANSDGYRRDARLVANGPPLIHLLDVHELNISRGLRQRVATASVIVSVNPPLPLLTPHQMK